MSGRVRIENRFDRVKSAEERATFKNLGHAGAVVRKISSRSITKGARRRQGSDKQKPSDPGKPPRTRRGGLKKAILFGFEGKDHVLIGPSVDLVGDSGSAHEHGGKFRGQTYPRRPFMQPGLEKLYPQIPSIWRDSIRE